MSLRRRCCGLSLGALLLAAGISPALRATADEGAKVIATAVGDGDDGDYGDGGPADQADLNEPRMLAFDHQGGYYIADTYHHVVRHVDSDGIISTFAGVVIKGTKGGFRDGPAHQALFDAPHGVDVMPDGDVLVGDPVNDRIRRIDIDTMMVTTIAGTGQTGYSGDGGPATAARLSDSKIAVVGPDGGIYIDDMGNDVIRRIDPVTGNIETWAGQKGVLGGKDGIDARASGFSPRNIAFDVDNDLIVADRDANTIRSIDWETRIITTIAGSGVQGPGGDGGPALDAELNSPRGLGVDWMGNVYIADSENNRVRKVHVDTAAGEDRYGIMTTVAGTGESGEKGDGGPATEAKLSNPRHAIFSAAGDMYIADSGGHRIRVVRGMVPPKPAGATTTTTTPTTAPPAGTPTTQPPTTAPTNKQSGTVARSGYWMLGTDGAVYPFGAAEGHGDPTRALPAGSTAADVEGTPSGEGYWVLDTTGRVHNFGDAAVLGSLGRGVMAAGETATSLSATPTGKGYWVFTTRGRAVAFGDADHLGDTSAIKLNAPVLDSVATPSGKGYYMVAGDGGIFSFGDARFWGSMGGQRLNAPVQSLVPDADGAGYWLVAGDGGVFAFEAPFRGSMGGTRLNKPITGMVRQGGGYLMVAEDGGIFNFSELPFAGSLGANPPARPIVAVATLPR